MTLEGKGAWKKKAAIIVEKSITLGQRNVNIIFTTVKSSYYKSGLE